MSIYDLGSSLYALHHSSANTPLTPDLRCRTLASGGVLNSLYEVIYLILDYFRDDKDSIRCKHMRKTLLHIEETFKEEQTRIKGVYVRYCTALKGADEKQLALCKQQITRWNRALTPADGTSLKQMMQRAKSAYSAAFNAYEPKWLNRFLHRSIAFDPVFDKLQQVQKWIDLEAAAQCTLPLEALQKLSLHQALGKEEEQKLTKWIDRANSSWQLSLSQLHSGLFALCSFWGKQKMFGHVEHELFLRGLKQLSASDPAHLLWREQLEQAGIVTIQGRQYRLKKRLGKHKNPDAHWVFTLGKSDEEVVVVGTSAASFLLEQAEAACLGIGVARVKVMDPSGRCALVERLTGPLAEAKDSADKQAAVAALICALLMHERTLQVTPDNLMFAKDGSLRLTKPVKQGKEFDFDRLVHLAKMAAGETPAIFRKILSESGLAQHELTDMYQAVVKDALSESPRGVDRIAATFSVSAVKPRKTARHLAQQILTLQDACVSDFLERYQLPEGVCRSDLVQHLRTPILRYYEQTIGAGILFSPSYKSIVDQAAEEMS